MASKRRPKRKQRPPEKQSPKQDEQPTPTPDELMAALLKLPADHKWRFLQKQEEEGQESSS